MRHARYLFVGNRFPVLSAMLEQGLALAAVHAVADSPLAAELVARGIPFVPLAGKSAFSDALRDSRFDVLVSNGCPHVLPVARLKAADQTFVNVHPSCLPDLRGVHPVNGAILFNRAGGATCHHMEEKVDAGAIIARMRIPLTPEIDLALLYRLSFAAEREVFLRALERSFVPDPDIARERPAQKPIYYTRKEADMVLRFDEDADAIVRRVRAFGVPSQLARFWVRGVRYTALDAERVTDPALLTKLEGCADAEIALVEEDSVVFRRGNALVRLKGVRGDRALLKSGQRLG